MGNHKGARGKSTLHRKTTGRHAHNHAGKESRVECGGRQLGEKGPKGDHANQSTQSIQLVLADKSREVKNSGRQVVGMKLGGSEHSESQSIQSVLEDKRETSGRQMRNHAGSPEYWETARRRKDKRGVRNKRTCEAEHCDHSERTGRQVADKPEIMRAKHPESNETK